MTEQKTLHFHYESIGNLIRLLATIRFESTHSSRDITVFHQRFRNEPDKLFEQFLIELYPDGADIGEKELNDVVAHICDFMQKDETTRDLYAAYDKRKYGSYVYFKPDKTVHYAEFANHANLVTRICCDYFKDFDTVDPDYLKRFIKENFEIKSENTTVEQVSNDANYIIREIYMNRKV